MLPDYDTVKRKVEMLPAEEKKKAYKNHHIDDLREVLEKSHRFHKKKDEDLYCEKELDSKTIQKIKASLGIKSPTGKGKGHE